MLEDELDHKLAFFQHGTADVDSRSHIFKDHATTLLYASGTVLYTNKHNFVNTQFLILSMFPYVMVQFAVKIQSNFVRDISSFVVLLYT